MKIKENKKAFVLTETLIASIFLVGIMTYVYVSILPLVGKYEDRVFRENDIDIVYKLYHIRKMLMSDISFEALGDIQKITCNDLENKDKCQELINNLELKKYQVIYTNSIKKNYDNLRTISKNLEDYIEKYKEENDEVLFLIDEDKNTIAHLKYQGR